MSYSFILLIGLFGFTIVLRILELIVAQRNKRQNLKDSHFSYYKEPYYFMFVVLHSSFLLFTPLEVYFLNRDFYPVLGIISVLVYISCVILRFHVFLVLKEKWNTELIVSSSPDFVVTKGIYSYIRHPNYLIVILEIFSLSLFHSAWISLVTFSALNLVLLLKYRIPTEENLLFQNSYYKEHFSNKGRFFPKF